MKTRKSSRPWRALLLPCEKITPAGTARMLVAVALVGLLSTACDVDTPTGPGALTSITVTPDITLAINATQQFTAHGVDTDGNVIVISPVWSIVEGGGTINGSGMFTAGAVLGVFTGTVMASINGISGTATVTVIAGPLATLEVTPNPATVEVDQSQQFTVVARDAGGNVVPITPSWAVVSSGGSIDMNTGLFTAGLVTGTYDNTVEAASGGISGAATVTVIAGAPATIEVTPNPATVEVDQSQQFTAVARDAGGNVVPITPSWAVVSSGGSIDMNTGLFTAGSVTGTFNNTVEATSGSLSGTATVTVTAPPPVSPLNSAANFGILAGAGIECAISGTVTGATTAADIGSSPTLTINGFPPCTYDGAIPLPSVVATAKDDLTAAYLAAQGEVCDIDLSGTDLGAYYAALGVPLPPGVYCFTSSATLTGTMLLSGSAAATWTFQIASTLDAEVGSQVQLDGGAIPDNVYWAVGTSATLKTDAAFKGNIMAQASISLRNGVELLGRALAQDGAVDLTPGAVSIVKP
jgi:hypothetical protein